MIALFVFPGDPLQLYPGLGAGSLLGLLGLGLVVVSQVVHERPGAGRE